MARQIAVQGLKFRDILHPDLVSQAEHFLNDERHKIENNNDEDDNRVLPWDLPQSHSPDHGSTDTSSSGQNNNEDDNRVLPWDLPQSRSRDNSLTNPVPDSDNPGYDDSDDYFDYDDDH